MQAPSLVALAWAALNNFEKDGRWLRGKAVATPPSSVKNTADLLSNLDNASSAISGSSGLAHSYSEIAVDTGN